MADIMTNIRGVLKRTNDFPIHTRDSLQEWHNDTFILMVTINSPVAPLKLNKNMSDKSIPAVFINNDGNFSDLVQKGFGITPTAVRSIGSQNWAAASLSDIGYIEAMPNYMIGTSVVFAPSSISPQDIQKVITKFAPLGTLFYFASYEEQGS